VALDAAAAAFYLLLGLMRGFWLVYNDWVVLPSGRLRRRSACRTCGAVVHYLTASAGAPLLAMTNRPPAEKQANKQSVERWQEWVYSAPAAIES
jgi:hypothetical protein